MRFVGDVHGHIDAYLRVRGEGPSFQIGDMGLGFPGVSLPAGGNHRFIRGNHDDPAQCKSHPNYAGDYGYDPDFKLFFMGGAFSIDFAWRQARMRSYPETPVWWADEELSNSESDKALALYEKSKPEIVATHDCPASVSAYILRKMLVGFRPEKDVPSQTGRWLQRMFERHQPRLWLFGHYHVDVAPILAGTQFICLSELSTKDV